MAQLRVEALRVLVAPDGLPGGLREPVSFEVAAGACLGISGASGSGKSLLLRALADLDPNEGRVFAGDLERVQLEGPEWRRRVAYVPAESAWWSEQIRAHFPGRRVQHLDALGFNFKFLRRVVSRLSTGERQRLALLRAINGNPEVLLLDEPTASLDPASTAQVEQLVAKLREQRKLAVVWVSHDARQVRRVSDKRMRLTDEGLVPVPRRRPRKPKPETPAV